MASASRCARSNVADVGIVTGNRDEVAEEGEDRGAVGGDARMDFV